MANYWQKRAYAELSTDPADLARRGLVYLMAQFFTVPATSSVSFVLETNGKNVEFQFYDITSDLGAVEAVLLEQPAYTRFGPTITPRNLNRNYADAATVTLGAASGISGGTAIASELVGAAIKAGGQVSQDKVHTLASGSAYVMSFYNRSNQPTFCHMNLGWSEGDPPPYRLVTSVDNRDTPEP